MARAGLIKPIIAEVDFKDTQRVNVEISMSFWFRYDVIVRSNKDLPATTSITVTCLFADSVDDIANAWAAKVQARSAVLRRKPWKLSGWIEILKAEGRMAVLVVPSLSALDDGGQHHGFQEKSSNTRYWVLKVSCLWLVSGFGSPRYCIQRIEPLQHPTS